MGRPRELIVAALLCAAACGDPEPARRGAEPSPRPEPEARAEPEAPAEPPPPPLPSGACRMVRSTRTAEPISLYEAKHVFDERGGLLVIRSREHGLQSVAISREGELGTPLTLGWPGESIWGVWRIGDRFAVALDAPCDADGVCNAVGVLDAQGRPMGAPRVGPGWRPELAHAGDGALHLVWTDRGAALALDRYAIADDGSVARTRLSEIAAPPTRPRGYAAAQYAEALAVSGERWALLVRETEAARVMLYSSARRAPVRLFPPIPRFGGVEHAMRFAGDHLELAGRVGPSAPPETPAWIMGLALDGRVLSGPLRLADGDTFHDNRVTGAMEYDETNHLFFARRDAIGRPIGERLPWDRAGEIAGEGRRFLVLSERQSEPTRAAIIECDQGDAPAPAQRVPFEADPDPREPCGAVACALAAPTMPALLRAVARKCESLAFEGRTPPADRLTEQDGLHVLRRRETGDAALPEVAAIECARGLSSMGDMGRWAFLAARTASGWTACSLDGMNSNYFDFELEVGEIRLESWLEGDPPEILVPVTIGQDSSDAGEIDASRGEDLHVCGMHDGALACWGSIDVWSESRSGSDGVITSRISERWRVEPDGRGTVAITREGAPPETTRRDVRRLRPGCPERPDDPR